MMTPQALKANAELDARFRIVRAWIALHPEHAPKLRHLNVHFEAWDEYQAENVLSRDPTKLQGFEGELAQCEAEAARYGYDPGEHVSVGDVVDRVAGGAAAQVASETAAEVSGAISEAAGAAARVTPWYVWAGAGLAAFGAIGLGVAYTRATLGPLADLARSSNNRRTRY